MTRNGWMAMPFSEAVLINPSVPLERGKTYPFVDMQTVDPNSRGVQANQERKFTGGGSRFSAGDTLMARITPCLENGKVARFIANDKGILGHGSTEFLVIRGRPSVSDTDFAYYLTRWDEVRFYAISQMTGTSGRQRVPTESFRHLEIPLPSLPEQRAIVHILGALDDKIELNRKMNETLEAMALALFKSWFVDFDPVRAKAAGRKPAGVTDDIANLFPNSFQDSELGKIPKGWRVGTISEEFNFTMGQSPPGETYNEFGEGIPFFQGRTDFGFRYPNHRVSCTTPKRFANSGDTLVSVRAPVGDINMVLEKCCIGRGVTAIRHKSGGRSFTYHFMRSISGTFENFEAEGTVFGCINKDDFRRIKHVIPPPRLVREFETMAFPLDQSVENNTLQSASLAAIRDALLPKLLSGEICVKDFEKIVEVQV